MKKCEVFEQICIEFALMLRSQARAGVRQRRIASTENGTRRSVSIATPKAARGTECSDETG